MPQRGCPAVWEPTGQKGAANRRWTAQVQVGAEGDVEKLYTAAEAGDLLRLQQLLEAVLALAAATDEVYGWTPLCFAVWGRQEGAARLLLTAAPEAAGSVAMLKRPDASLARSGAFGHERDPAPDAGGGARCRRHLSSRRHTIQGALQLHQMGWPSGQTRPSCGRRSRCTRVQPL